MSETLFSLLKEVKQLSKRQFLAKYPSPWLLSELIKAIQAPSSRSDGSIASTETMKQGAMRMLASKPSALALQTRPQNFQIWALTKTSRNMWEERIIIGRDDTSDIVFDDASVSKAHAYFSQKGSQFLLTALPSLNPTKINGALLKPHGAGVVIVDGNALEFGLAGCRFIETASLYGFLKP